MATQLIWGGPPNVWERPCEDPHPTLRYIHLLLQLFVHFIGHTKSLAPPDAQNISATIYIYW